VALEVAADVARIESSAFTNPNGDKLARSNEGVNASPRDTEKAANLSDSQKLF
jgi:hypothetical protein